MARSPRQVLAPLMAGTAAMLALGTAAAQAPGDEAHDNRHRLRFELALDAYAADTPLPGWTDGGVGKLRYDEAHDGLVASRWFADYRGLLTPTLTLHVVADYVDDATDGLDLTEAYLEWRPVPHSPLRHGLKAGLFMLPGSLENTDRGWTSPYTLSFSAIDTWIAEEVRPLGIEWSAQRPLGPPGSPHRLGFHAGAFVGNDPAGSLLAWKGWSLHDRQSRLGDELPLAALPQLESGMMFERQAPYVEPFREVDGRTGFYAGADWRYGQRVWLLASRYDNRADPTAFEAGQYAWHTAFDQVALQLALPAGLGLVAQWMQGTTVMGPVLATRRAVDAGFAARFVLLTKRFARQRISLRYDDFSVSDYDGVPDDENTEWGHAWTLSYRYTLSARLFAAAEWLSVETYREMWEGLGWPDEATERSLELRLSMTLP